MVIAVLPAGDWRIGGTFCLSTGLQAVALWVAGRQSKADCMARVTW